MIFRRDLYPRWPIHFSATLTNEALFYQLVCFSSFTKNDIELLNCPCIVTINMLTKQPQHK